MIRQERQIQNGIFYTHAENIQSLNMKSVQFGTRVPSHAAIFSCPSLHFLIELNGGFSSAAEVDRICRMLKYL